jgi:hypothetical protein
LLIAAGRVLQMFEPSLMQVWCRKCRCDAGVMPQMPQCDAGVMQVYCTAWQCSHMGLSVHCLTANLQCSSLDIVSSSLDMVLKMDDGNIKWGSLYSASALPQLGQNICHSCCFMCLRCGRGPLPQQQPQAGSWDRKRPVGCCVLLVDTCCHL